MNSYLELQYKPLHHMWCEIDSDWNFAKIQAYWFHLFGMKWPDTAQFQFKACMENSKLVLKQSKSRISIFMVRLNNYKALYNRVSKIQGFRQSDTRPDMKSDTGKTPKYAHC